MTVAQRELVDSQVRLGGRIGFWGAVVGVVQAAALAGALLLANPAGRPASATPSVPARSPPPR